MRFQELTDEQWGVIEPLLPPRAHVGRPRVNDRQVINGMLYVLLTGCRWMDLPKRYGAYQTVWRRHRELAEQGLWERAFAHLLASASSASQGREVVAVDATTLEAKKGARGWGWMASANAGGARSMP